LNDKLVFTDYKLDKRGRRGGICIKPGDLIDALASRVDKGLGGELDSGATSQ
jgi:hypothetical protein